MKREVLRHEFVDYVPDRLEDGVIYVCIQFATAVHLCCSGCGREVVTPISPADWILTYDGESISLSPSIGNWSFPCQSHYWIRENKVQWARQWSPEMIEAGRKRDRMMRERHFDGQTTEDDFGPASSAKQAKPSIGFWRKLWKGLFS